jgi:predicted Zn-dependent protease
MRSEEVWREFCDVVPAADFFSLRYVNNKSQELSVRQSVLQPPLNRLDEGVMITIRKGSGYGYGATSDLSRAGLEGAAQKALAWAKVSAQHTIAPFEEIRMPAESGGYQSKVVKPWNQVSLNHKMDLLRRANVALKHSSDIVDYYASLWSIEVEQHYFSSAGSKIEQNFTYVMPMLSATAFKDGQTQTRTFSGYANCRQGGFELTEEFSIEAAAAKLPDEALQLLSAPNCPSGNMALLLAPDQMILQIHESIGHPLELDRILGDERNYAGTSFVTLDMFGSYQYGSSLLNVTFDPSVNRQLCSYAFDDEGLPAKKEFLIKNGILTRPLGGTVSQARAKLPGVANVRAENWNRPPIDRMANLNLEPGKSSLDEMIAAVEEGVYMQTNCSWSIDDSRNKFQFGCEWGRTIKNGKLGNLVKNPNYRGVSATFWRNLQMVGGPDTNEVLGTPFCGKGEPNQVVRVGHATPACLFNHVDVFGGA